MTCVDRLVVWLVLRYLLGICVSVLMSTERLQYESSLEEKLGHVSYARMSYAGVYLVRI